MLKEALEYIVGLKSNQVYEIGGETYSERPLVRVAPHVDRPELIEVCGLDSVAQMIRAEFPRVKKEMGQIYVHVKRYNEVLVFTGWDGLYERNYLYHAEAVDVPGFHEGFREYEKAIIELRSGFAPGEGVDYLLNLLGRISRVDSVVTEDNGVSQSVEARSGIALKKMEEIRPRVKLRPFRTFLEVEQPESEFLVQLDKEGRVGLFEADGGMWKIAAKNAIVGYFNDALEDLVDDGSVIVMR